jgi:type I restriction enzyme R subunit
MPIDERSVHKDIAEKLEELGWERLPEKHFREHQLIEDYLILDIFKEQLERINEPILNRLETNEREEVLLEVKNIFLRENDPIKTLDYLKKGITVTLKKGVYGKEHANIGLIDYENPESNVFHYGYETKYKGEPESSKPDFTLFINGIPIAIIEAKKEFSTEETYQQAIRDILTYEKRSPKLFNFVQFAVVYADSKRYLPTIPNPDKGYRVKKEEIWRGEDGKEDIFHLIEPIRVVEIIKDYIFYAKDRRGNLKKILPRYMQYYAVKKALRRIKNYLEDKENKRKGLIWHWQGSGKTYEMLYLTELFMYTFERSYPHVFVIVDREDLEEQTEGVFLRIENARFKNFFKKIEDSEELKQVLRNIKEQEGNPSLTFKGVYLVMMHKFKRDVFEELGKGLESIKKREILILRDEVHRTEYGVLASVRRALIENALEFGFTGTPVNKKERNTFMEYAYPEEGEFYLDKFFIENSQRDGFTLPISWKAVSVKGIREPTEEEIKEVLEHFGLEDEEIDKKEVKGKLGIRDYLISEDRIKEASRYIAEHIGEDTEDFSFKAFVVAENRYACILYKKYLDDFLTQKYGEEARDWTQVVMTYMDSEGEKEIEKYRNQIEKKYGKRWDELNEGFKEDFKDRDKSPRLLVVTDMLITGYDADILKVMYIDKLMRDHQLLQAAARVNRPMEGKKFGVVVDLTGVLIEEYKKAIVSYNLYEDEEIKRDLANFLFIDPRKIWKGFLDKYKDFKEKFKSIASISWKDFIEKLENRKLKREQFDEVISVISLNSNIFNFIALVKEVIELFKALGSYPDKLNYYEEIEWLKIVYYSIRRKINPKSSDIPWKEIKRELVKKIGFDPFEKQVEITLDEKELDKLKDEKRLSIIVADLLYIMMEEAESRKEPIYREIYERLKELKEKYMQKLINTREMVKELLSHKVKQDEYESTIKGKSLAERIILNLRYAFGVRGYKSIEFKHTACVLNELENKPRIPQTVWDKLKAALHKDLMDVIKDVADRDQKINLLVEDYIKPIMERFHEEKSSRHS